MDKLTGIFKHRNDTPPNPQIGFPTIDGGSSAPSRPPIGFEGLNLNEDASQQSVENTSLPGTYYHYEYSNGPGIFSDGYSGGSAFAGSSFGGSGIGNFSGLGNFRNPFDDPFFKNGNSFPSFLGDRFKPTQPDPPKPTRPDPPKPTPPSPSISEPKLGPKSAGRKLIINLPSGILSRFNEFVEKNKSNEGVKLNIVKNPKKFRESFCKIVKESHVQNFIASQDYSAIKKRFSNTNRFTDTEFKACQASLYFSGTFQQNLLRNSSGIVWKRAKDLVSEPHFAVDEKGIFADPRHINESNYKRFYHTTDLDQGALGNCWFISAAAGIIQNYDLFRKVVPFDNSLETNEYTGAFRFRFWLFGEWKEVVVGKLI